MIFTIVIVLIVVLVLMAIGANAMQQHKERKEAEKRAEVAKLKAIIDETEDVLMSAGHIPISPATIGILHGRIVDALKGMLMINPQPDLKQRIQDATTRAEQAATTGGGADLSSFQLPDNEKQIIAIIQGIKKIRALLKAEHSKGKVDPHLFMQEDKLLDGLQLRVNVETLVKRGNSALETNMLGSSRQYFEKALTALSAVMQPDEYVLQRKQFVEDNLSRITEQLKNTNAADRAKKAAEEQDDLDVLFAPKKKW
jgi:type II secretory pathway pseudopilin PulG